jgi:hypothetical protein
MFTKYLSIFALLVSSQVACIFFVFLTLLEFTLLTWRRHLEPTSPGGHEDGNDSPEVRIKDKVKNCKGPSMSDVDLNRECGVR